MTLADARKRIWTGAMATARLLVQLCKEVQKLKARVLELERLLARNDVLGQTAGRTKQGNAYLSVGTSKSIYIYELHQKARRYLRDGGEC